MANTKPFNKLFHNNIREKHLFSSVGQPISASTTHASIFRSNFALLSSCYDNLINRNSVSAKK